MRQPGATGGAVRVRDGDHRRGTGTRGGQLPTGMLQAGAAPCIGSSWSMSDVSTALLMRRSYELWRAGIGPSEALRCAQ